MRKFLTSLLEKLAEKLRKNEPSVVVLKRDITNSDGKPKPKKAHKKIKNIEGLTP
jgi:Ni2+-binding GTPase involved in maturation of urease and hydrogenase